MVQERRIRLLKEHGGDSVCVPREFALSSDEAILRKEGDRLVIEPLRKPSLHELLVRWKHEPLKEDFGPIEDLPPEPVAF